MAITETKTIGKLIFWPLAVISTIFTCVLFWDFGFNYATAFMMSIVGLSIEFAKLFSLAKWQNAVLLKKRIKIVYPILYVSLALGSAIASMVFGISSIERQSVMASGSDAKVQELNWRIAEAEKRVNAYSSYDADAERKALDKQIDAMTQQITNITIGVAERSINMTKEITRLQDLRRQIGVVADVSMDELVSNLSVWRTERGQAMKANAGVKNSFNILAKIMGVSVDAAMVWFLLYAVVIMEIFMALTSGPAISGGIASMLSSPKKKTKGKKKTAQMHFEDLQK